MGKKGQEGCTSKKIYSDTNIRKLYYWGSHRQNDLIVKPRGSLGLILTAKQSCKGPGSFSFSALLFLICRPLSPCLSPQTFVPLGLISTFQARKGGNELNGSLRVLLFTLEKILSLGNFASISLFMPEPHGQSLLQEAEKTNIFGQECCYSKQNWSFVCKKEMANGYWIGNQEGLL